MDFPSTFLVFQNLRCLLKRLARNFYFFVTDVLIIVVSVALIVGIWYLFWFC